MQLHNGLLFRYKNEEFSALIWKNLKGLFLSEIEKGKKPNRRCRRVCVAYYLLGEKLRRDKKYTLNYSHLHKQILEGEAAREGNKCFSRKAGGNKVQGSTTSPYIPL